MFELIGALVITSLPIVALIVMVTSQRRARDKFEMERRIHRSRHFECPQGEYCDESLRSCLGYKEPVSA